MKEITHQTFPHERDLYGARDLKLVDCAFDGAEDGESALKEAQRIRLQDCYMNLRYPLWHTSDVALFGVTMTENCRAALWYARNVRIKNARLLGIKAVRECSDVTIDESEIVSPEFGWKCQRVALRDSSVQSEYLFLQASDLQLTGVRFQGKYSFQYAERVTITDCAFDTKDAFWHAKDVTVQDSVIRGEYLGWYSENLTLIRCKIIGTQPLCYCKGLRLIDCEAEAADLAFEYSDVEAEMRGEVLSVKNPRSGKITADRFGAVLLTADSVYPCACALVEREKRAAEGRKT